MGLVKSQIIGVDFDGTIVEHRFPEIGPVVPGAVETLRDLKSMGHRLILWTVRDGKWLHEAQEFLASNGLNGIFWAVNENPEQTFSESPKAHCNLYIDDAALGVPLVRPMGVARPYVDWDEVRRMLNMDDLPTEKPDWEDE